MVYTINNKMFDTDSIQTEIIGSGNEGILYKIDDEAVKIYDRTCFKDRLGEGAVDILNKIPTKRILLPKNKVRDKFGNFCGYTTKYVEEVNHNPFTYTMKEYLNELKMYEQDIYLLNQFGVCTADMTFYNIVYSKNSSIYMVDPGSFFFNNLEAIKSNHIELNRLFIQILSFGLQSENQYRKLCSILQDENNLHDSIKNTLDDENESITNYSLKLLNRR